MEKLPSNPIFEFNPNQLQEVRVFNGYEDTKKMNEAIDALDDWINKQNHFAVKDFDREYLERLIIYNRGSIERAKQRLERICTLRTLLPEMICNIDAKNEFRNLRNFLQVCMFPKPTKDNYRIIYVSFLKTDDSYDMMSLFRYTYLVYHYILYNDYSTGMECIFDLRQFSFSMLEMLSLSDSYRDFMMPMQCFGSRIKAFHIVISTKVVDGILVLFKKCLSDKLYNRIQVHSSYESVCMVIDKSVLPVENGGEHKTSLKNLSGQLFRELCSKWNLARIKYLDTAVTIESQRLSTTFNEEYSGMPGSFKTLCVD